MLDQHQNKIMGSTDTFQVSIRKQLGNFLVATRGNDRFSNSVKTAGTD